MNTHITSSHYLTHFIEFMILCLIILWWHFTSPQNWFALKFDDDSKPLTVVLGYFIKQRWEKKNECRKRSTCWKQDESEQKLTGKEETLNNREKNGGERLVIDFCNTKREIAKKLLLYVNTAYNSGIFSNFEEGKHNHKFTKIPPFSLGFPKYPSLCPKLQNYSQIPVI